MCSSDLITSVDLGVGSLEAKGAEDVILMVKAAITGAFVALDAVVLWAGTVVDWAFLHRSTLMFIGIATGAAWMFAVGRRRIE